jgi:hypothetical protein
MIRAVIKHNHIEFVALLYGWPKNTYCFLYGDPATYRIMVNGLVGSYLFDRRPVLIEQNRSTFSLNSGLGQYFAPSRKVTSSFSAYCFGLYTWYP